MVIVKDQCPHFIWTKMKQQSCEGLSSSESSENSGGKSVCFHCFQTSGLGVMRSKTCCFSPSWPSSHQVMCKTVSYHCYALINRPYLTSKENAIRGRGTLLLAKTIHQLPRNKLSADEGKYNLGSVLPPQELSQQSESFNLSVFRTSKHFDTFWLVTEYV